MSNFQTVLQDYITQLEADVALVSTRPKSTRISAIADARIALGGVGGSSAQSVADAIQTVTNVEPVGNHGLLTTPATLLAVEIVKPANATVLLLQLELNSSDIRLTVDGTLPTAELGFQFFAGERVSLSVGPSAQVHILGLGPNAVLGQYQWSS